MRRSAIATAAGAALLLSLTQLPLLSAPPPVSIDEVADADTLDRFTEVTDTARDGKDFAAALLAPREGAPVPVLAENVEHVANIPGSTGGHVDITGDRLYLGTYGYGFRIFDISEPDDPQLIGEYIPGPQSADDPGARADAVPTGFDVDDRHFVVLNGTNRARGTQQSEFLDVTDPGNPVLLHRFMGAADGEAHVGNIANDRLWWIPSGGSGENGFRIYDLSPLLGDDPQPPVNLFRGDPVALWKESPHYRRQGGPEPAFTHTHDLQIYTDHPVQVGEDADGTPVMEPRDIILMAEGGNYLGDGNTGSIIIVDITDPENPVALNRWRQEWDDPDAHPIRYYHEVRFLDGDPSVMIVTDEDMHNGCEAGGIYTVGVSADLTQAEKLGEWFNGTGTPAPVCSVHVFDTLDQHVYIGSYNAGLQILDLSDPANPVRAGQYIAPGNNSWGAVAHEGLVYVGDMGARGLDVYRFTPPEG